MESSPSLEDLNAAICSCRRCPRLVRWREQVAREKRAAYASDAYWGRPVPSFGDPEAGLLIVGLAPAAHGANRTGRMFTGDRSGDWLFRALYRAGFASQPASSDRADGLTLSRAWLTAAVRCAPPDNRPSPSERDNCASYLARELELLESARVIVCLGGFAYDQLLRLLRGAGEPVPRPKPAFGHGVEVVVAARTILCSYHPSQQNTFTGRLTEEMFDDVWQRASELLEG